MKYDKVIASKFEWTPPSVRKSRFGDSLLTKNKHNKLPLLWLARDGNELFLVNSSGEPLDYVIFSNNGFETAADDIVTYENPCSNKYENIQHNNAVKIDEYDGYYDLDKLFQVHIKIKSPSLGEVEIYPPPKKGGLNETILIWDNGEAGRNVHIKSLNC